MCWFTEKKTNELVASEDIICYKVFRKKDIVYETNPYLVFGIGKPKIIQLKSFVQNFKYIPYVRQKSVDLHIEPCVCATVNYTCYSVKEGVKIEAGYHSYATIARAKPEKMFLPKIAIIECIIPKGAIYYLNESNEIVSSTIIITDKIVK